MSASSAQLARRSSSAARASASTWPSGGIELRSTSLETRFDVTTSRTSITEPDSRSAIETVATGRVGPPSRQTSNPSVASSVRNAPTKLWSAFSTLTHERPGAPQTVPSALAPDGGRRSAIVTTAPRCQFAPPWGHPFCRVMGPGGTVGVTAPACPETPPASRLVGAGPRSGRRRFVAGSWGHPAAEGTGRRG